LSINQTHDKTIDVLMVSPAPPRGRYDRNLSPAARASLQRQRLLWATAEALAGQDASSVSVAAIAKCASVGRNTFYEHFEDAPAAVRAAARHAATLLEADIERTLQTARTPLERVRTLAAAWIDWIAARPELARVALRSERGPKADLLSPAAAILLELLRGLVTEGRQAATFSAAPDESRFLACAAASEVLALAVMDGRTEPSEATATLADLMTRTFR
jgi:AcrR family transcriptional regulator